MRFSGSCRPLFDTTKDRVNLPAFGASATFERYGSACMGGLKGENGGRPRAGAIQSSRDALVVEHSADSKMIYWVILKPDGGLGTCD